MRKARESIDRVLGRTSIATLRQRAFPAVKDQILHLSTQRSGPLDPVHVRASTSLLPDFDPVEVGGRLLCDGGFSENLPLRAVLGTPPERPAPVTRAA